MNISNEFMYRRNGQRLRNAAVAVACWCVLLSFWNIPSTVAFGSSVAKKFEVSRTTNGVLSRQLSTALVARSGKSSSSSSASTTTALAMAALTLYGHPGTRSPLVNWACYELGVDFTMASDLSQNPHPFGQLPCLTDRDEENNSEMIILFESGAILQYLLRYYSANSLTKAQQAAIISWITWANASLDPICFLETPDGNVYDTGLKKPNRRMQRLNDILSRQQYLVAEATNDGNQSNSIFTIADVAVASYLLYVLQFFPDTDLQSQWPDVVRYLKDCASRPAYGQAFGDRVQSYLVQTLSEQQQRQKPDSKKLFGMF